jgi:hypothetical protein
MILAYFRDASRESSSDLAPVTTILPDANIRAVVLGSRIRITTAAKRCIISRSPSEARGEDDWGRVSERSEETEGEVGCTVSEQSEATESVLNMVGMV